MKYIILGLFMGFIGTSIVIHERKKHKIETVTTTPVLSIDSDINSGTMLSNHPLDSGTITYSKSEGTFTLNPAYTIWINQDHVLQVETSEPYKLSYVLLNGKKFYKQKSKK